MKIICIIPIYNEESRLDLLLNEVKNFQKKDPYKTEFLLINNGSNDNTDKIINSYDLKSIRIKKNRGIGYALLLGLKIAKSNNYDILIQLSGNFKMSPFDIPNMLKPIFDENVDYVSGTRFIKKENYINNPIFRKLSIKALSVFFSLLFKKKITDATCGFRAFKIDKVIKYFYLFNKKKYYTYGYEYYSYGKMLILKNIKTSEASVKMNYPLRGKYSKIRPVIDWIPVIFGYLNAFFDKKN